MKFYLRGLFAAGLFAVATVSALADTPAPPIAPTAPGSPSATLQPRAGTSADIAPSAVIPGTADCGCGSSAGEVLGTSGSRRGRLFGGRLLGGAGGGIGGGGGQLGSAFERLAGPPVYPTADSAFGKFRDRPTTQPGTVVFPQHPFARSPRDFFMMEQP